MQTRGTQRTDSPPLFAAIRTLHRLACVLEAMHDALNQRRAADPTWVQQRASLEWYDRYRLRADQGRLPTEARTREGLAGQSGVDGSALLDGVWATARAPYLRDL